MSTNDSDVLWLDLGFLNWIVFFKFYDLFIPWVGFFEVPLLALEVEKGDKLSSLLVEYPFSPNFSFNLWFLRVDKCIFCWELSVGIIWFLFHLALIGDTILCFSIGNKFLKLVYSYIHSLFSLRPPCLADFSWT